VSSRPSLRDAPMPPRLRRDPAEVFGGPLPQERPPSPRSSPPPAVATTALVRPRFLRRPRPGRADGRCKVTYEVHPVLAGLVDEAAELLADELGRKLDRSAYYEALLAAGLRHLRAVLEELRADPAGERIAARLVAELEASGGVGALLAQAGAGEAGPMPGPTQADSP
jgi:hypothetical protein